ncbi:MAG: acyltransferase [Pseudomonadota bacterium]
MRMAHLPLVGGLARRIAAWGVPRHYGLWPLANLVPAGYVAPSAQLFHERLSYGKYCFLGDEVLIYGEPTGGSVELGDRVHIHQRTTLQTGQGGSILIDQGTHIQPDCLLSGFMGDVKIGKNVEIAAKCSFYSYNHQFEASQAIREQPIISAGGLEIGDEAWLGVGVIVLDGAKIGKGAVVAAGAVVNRDIPDFAIAAGNPARVIGRRT